MLYESAHSNECHSSNQSMISISLRFMITWKQSPDSSHDWINNLCVIRRGSFLSLSMLSTWNHEPYSLLWNPMIHGFNVVSIKPAFENNGIWMESFYGGFNGVSAWTWILHRISYETPLGCRLNAFLRYVWHNPANHSIWTMVSYTMKCENIVNIP